MTYKNNEGYSDPTAGAAMSNMMREYRQERKAQWQTEHDAKTRELEAELQSARDQITTMQKEQQEVAERHSKKLEEAKRLGAEEEQQKFANMSWLERIQKKS